MRLDPTNVIRALLIFFQKTLHSGTFHPTMKAWLFLGDEIDENGSFTYVSGSHQLSWKRLKWEYKKVLLLVCSLMVIANTHDFHCRGTA